MATVIGFYHVCTYVRFEHAILNNCYGTLFQHPEATIFPYEMELMGLNS
jgi:hypothetical protein